MAQNDDKALESSEKLNAKKLWMAQKKMASVRASREKNQRRP